MKNLNPSSILFYDVDIKAVLRGEEKEMTPIDNDKIKTIEFIVGSNHCPIVKINGEIIGGIVDFSLTMNPMDKYAMIHLNQMVSQHIRKQIAASVEVTLVAKVVD